MFAEVNKKVVSIDWGINTEKFEYRKCSEMEEGKVIPVKGLFISADHGYGRGAVAILDDVLLNLPERYLEVVESILATDNMVEAIKAGKCGLVITSFMSKKFKRKGYDVEFVDVD